MTLRLWAFFSALILFGLLSGCGPIYNTEYSYIPPKSNMGHMCIAQCTYGRSNCEQLCQMRKDNCLAEARRDAREEYYLYERERRRQGKDMDRTLSDFERSHSSYRCEQSCQCAPQFNSCYSACGGQVLERQVCVAFCDKQ